MQVVRTMTEVATKDTLTYLCKLVKDSLELTADFWGTIESGSKLLPLLDVSADQELEANQRFRHLVTLFNRITLLSDVFSTAGYAHGRAAISLLQTLMGSGSPDVVPDLGALHRACIWENIFLKAGLTARGIDTLPSPVSSPLEQSPARPSVPLPEADGASSTNGVQGESTTTPVSPPQPSASKQGGTQELNAKALKHLTHGLPSTLAPFFQGSHLRFCTYENNLQLYLQLSSNYSTPDAIRIQPRRSRSWIRRRWLPRSCYNILPRKTSVSRLVLRPAFVLTMFKRTKRHRTATTAS